MRSRAKRLPHLVEKLPHLVEKLPHLVEILKFKMFVYSYGDFVAVDMDMQQKTPANRGRSRQNI